MQEGEQYRLNRIEFTGNDVTHDEVIRRELQIVENSVFNTEALRRSVRRLNQPGCFFNIELYGSWRNARSVDDERHACA